MRAYVTFDMANWVNEINACMDLKGELSRREIEVLKREAAQRVDRYQIDADRRSIDRQLIKADRVKIGKSGLREISLVIFITIVIFMLIEH
jgi:hypothetical protein